MSRIKVSIVILFLVTVFCVCEYTYVGKTAEEYIEKIHTIEECYEEGNTEKALEVAIEADESWKRKLEYVDMLLYHDYVNEIGVNLSSIAKYVEYEEDAEVFANCEMTKRELQSLVDNEKPSLANII